MRPTLSRPAFLAAALLALAALLPAPARAQDPAAIPASGADPATALAASPRHGEWAMVPVPPQVDLEPGRAPGTIDSVRAWVVYPERAEKAPVVLVLHEIYGLTDWIRAVADRLAAEGFIAVAPDLLSGKGVPRAPDTGEPERELAVAAVRRLDPDEVHRRLLATADWAMALPAAADRYGIVGFCWGGSTSFAHAVRSASLGAAVVYYGASPDTADLDRVRAPVLGLYGGDDARVNATIPDAEARMEELGRTYEVRIFEGAGHGFLRQQDGRDGANLRASLGAWPLTVDWFRRYLDG